tara:strand:+ start:749 stop:964 length:216 start_codon:yes stop_codon:yes gene_type:complete
MLLMEISSKELIHIKNGLAKEMARYKHEHDEKREKEVEQLLHRVEQLLKNHIPNDKNTIYYTRAATSTEET